MSLAGVLVFALTYVLISARRLSWLPFDRPAVVLLGAVLCVVFRALTPEQALSAVDGSTMLLLFGVMGMGTFLAVGGFFDAAEPRLVAFARTPTRLLGCVVWSAGLLSALITNDAVCMLGAPVLVGLIRRYRLPPLPFLLALATGSNTGSVATLVGNPQNMLCELLGGLSYRQHLFYAAPIALLGLAVNHGLLHAIFRASLRGALEPTAGPLPPLRSMTVVTLGVIGGTAIAYTFGANLPWAATSAFVLLMLLHRHDTRQLWPRIDWSLLLFFSGLFIVVEALVHSGAPALFFARYPLASGGEGLAWWARLTGIFLIGSNVVSNVPFILLVKDQMATLPEPRLAWELLAVASTFAGNLTLLGSAANVIVAENARELGGIGFFAYLKVGLPLTLITTAIGAAWLLAFFPGAT